MKLLTILILTVTAANYVLAETKSHVPGSRDGSYLGSIDSHCHKGGHYSNIHTRDHYRDRAVGVPY